MGRAHARRAPRLHSARSAAARVVRHARGGLNQEGPEGAGALTDLNRTQTSGIPPLDNEAIRAIREAAPFAPFPERMKFERLNIRAAFYYYNTRARVRGE